MYIVALRRRKNKQSMYIKSLFTVVHADFALLEALIYCVVGQQGRFKLCHLKFYSQKVSFYFPA